MSVEVRPLGVACNLGCQYCYQNAQRDTGAAGRAYDLDAMLAALDREGSPFTVFGGEPLLVPLPDLERLWAFGLARHGANSVQTNATLITEDHLRAFETYRVAVGVSLDGPGALNDVRWAGTLAATRAATARSQAAVARLCDDGRPPGLIVTLHRHNAAADRIDELAAWFAELDAMGVRSVRLHLLEVDHDDVRRRWALSDAENLTALLRLAELEPTLRHLRFDLFGDLRALLVGDDEGAPCVWQGCDPWTTPAVRGVEGDGRATNCGRVYKDGVEFTKTDGSAHERVLSLQVTPQSEGGCAGCRFFVMCKGQCPGTAIDGDWRNRSEHCGAWMGLFERLEAGLVAEGVTPLSRSAWLPAVAAALTAGWSAGRPVTIAAAVAGLGHPALDSAPSAPADPAAAGAGGDGTAGVDGASALPAELLRVAWVSEGARRVWEPRLAAIGAAWAEIEWRSVLAGVRRCAIVAVTPTELLAHGAGWSTAGLTALPLELDRSRPEPGRRSGPAEVVIRFAVGTPADVAAFATAWQAGDEQAMGELLGYPACCTRFFHHVWVDGGLDDTTWPMAVASAGAPPETAEIELDGRWAANTAWRPLGVRPVSHLPCRVDCAPTAELAGRFRQVGRDLGYAQEMAWLTDVLSWPLSWSALHGLAEVVTPVLKLAVPTDPGPGRRTLRWRGGAYPEEGATGRSFPFAAPGHARMTGSAGFRRGLQLDDAEPVTVDLTRRPTPAGRRS